MNIRARIKGWIVVAGLSASAITVAALLWTPPAEAARCCWVMVCSDTACWEVCKPCPKLP